jgi:immunoglobulin-like protein involved in spore germination
VQSGAFLIDDRPAIHSLRLENHEIVLGADIHGTHDPACCAEFAVTETYRLANGGLEFSSLASNTPNGTRRSLAILSPPDGSEVGAGPVQIRGSFTVLPFENTLTYRAYDAAQNELTSGPITLPSSPGAGCEFEASVDLGSVPAGTLVTLEIADISAADGGMLAMVSIQLMIK